MIESTAGFVSWKNVPTSRAANCIFRTSTYATRLHHVSQPKDSPKSLFYSLNSGQNK